MGITLVNSPINRHPVVGGLKHSDSVREQKQQRSTHDAEPEPNVITHQDPTQHLAHPAQSTVPEPRDDASDPTMGRCYPAHMQEFAQLFSREAQIGVVGPED